MNHDAAIVSPARPAGDCWVCDGPVASSGDLVRCPGCGFALRRHPDGSVAGTHDATGVAYPEDGAELTLAVEDSSFWFAHRNRVLDAILVRYPPGGTLWDVGGGNGFQARHFQQQERRVVVVEPGPAGCRNARRRGVTLVVESTLEGLRLPDGMLRAISTLDVLEHLAHPAALLAECRRVLGPGGRLYVTVPAFGFLWSDEDVYARHERRYTKAALARQLETAGFAVEYLSYYFQALLVPVLLARTLPFRLMPWRAAHRGQTMDPTEHTPEGATKKVLTTLLGRELAAIRRGDRLAFGSSLVAVARRD